MFVCGNSSTAHRSKFIFCKIFSMKCRHHVSIKNFSALSYCFQANGLHKVCGHVLTRTSPYIKKDIIWNFFANEVLVNACKSSIGLNNYITQVVSF